MSYISPERAREILVEEGLSTVDNPISEMRLQRLIMDISARLDSWLGYHPALQEYVEIVAVNGFGRTTLKNYPVVEVSPVIHKFDFDPAVPPTVLEAPLAVLWQPNTTLIEVGYAGIVIEVRYRAGYDPLPEIFEATFIDALIAGVQAVNSGQPAYLAFDSPIRDVTSLSVPGISKSFQLGGKAKDGSWQGNTVLDRIFARLAPYRRIHKF